MQRDCSQPFLHVFQKIPLDVQSKQILKDALVTNIKVSKTSNQILVSLLLPQIIHQEILDRVRMQIQNQFVEGCCIEFKIRYDFEEGALTESSAVKKLMYLYWDNILHTIHQNSPISTGILRDSKWKVHEEHLVISVKHNHSYYLKKKKLDTHIQDMLKEQLGLCLQVIFEEDKNTDAQRAEYEQELDKTEEALVRQVAVHAHPIEQPSSSEGSAGENRKYTSVLLGKSVPPQSIKIREANQQEGEVIIEGNILTLEAREIKGGKYIVSFDITDFTDSTTVKVFIKKEKYEQEIDNRLKKNSRIRIRGEVQFDKYSKELIVMARDLEEVAKLSQKMDRAQKKRVELHLHTQMSRMDGISSATALVQKAAEWGHPAIAITDHGVVQAYPDAAAAGKKFGIKVLYGVEAYLIDDLGAVVQSPKGQSLQDSYVVFDIETTGLTYGKDRITEIGAVKVSEGQIIDYFNSFINPKVLLSDEIIKLTGITNEMLCDAPTIEEVLPKFLDFVGDAVLVAHNANFDMGFIRYFAQQISRSVEHTVLDTLELSRTLFPQLKKHKLGSVAQHLGISLENHHRALEDAKATAEIFIHCMNLLKERQINTVDEINILASENIDFKKLKAYHAIILVKNYTGLKNLYRLISKSHMDYFYRRPRIPKSVLMKYREGLVIGSACEAGELYRGILEQKPEDYIRDITTFYDYLEIQPLGNNQFLLDSGKVQSPQQLKEINKQIILLGEKYQKPVVATCDVHFLNPEDEVYRRIIMAGEGFADADNQAPLYLRTTDEMLEEFSYLGKEKAWEVVVENTNLIADSIEEIKPIPDETFPPKIDGAEEELTRITQDKAKEIYGEILPTTVQERLDRELNSIIKNGFAVMYIIAQKLVWKSLEDGYLVGSRGSVGSSFVATMASITEVNPLPPHYVCPMCRYSDFDSPVVKSFAGGSGCDMPTAQCPTCNTNMNKDGHDIPFETFLGFDGDKEPDIDLNFSGEYQSKAHAYTEELFGDGHVFRAGTIGTMAEKTAYGFVRKYLDERGRTVHNAEVNRLVQGCTGIKRTTGQHPGGLMVVPRGHEIFEFCPIQRPANDMNSSITTTHFDYHSISGRLLKLDILGHDDPTVIRMLEDLTGINAQEIPLDDPKTMSLFTSTEALGVSSEDINSEVGSYGLPEFGTKFVRQMLLDTKPKTFAELIRISGLSHGTDVWLNNAQELVRGKTATLKQVISTRDDIMVYLIIQGVEKKQAFKIMEKVRKGQGLTSEDEEAMLDAGVAEWYIDSCKKIKYMFPKAHAAAYVMMAFRIAFFKVYYPESFYCAYFSVRAEDFDYELMCKGASKAKASIRDIEAKGILASTKEKNTLTILEIVVEMYARGFQFVPLDIYKSHAVKFQITPEGLLPPLNSLQGLGTTAAYSIMEVRTRGEFLSIEEFRMSTKVSKTVIEILKQNEILQGIPETNQLSLFG